MLTSKENTRGEGGTLLRDKTLTNVKVGLTSLADTWVLGTLGCRVTCRVCGVFTSEAAPEFLGSWVRQAGSRVASQSVVVQQNSVGAAARQHVRYSRFTVQHNLGGCCCEARC
jgi:hypothetical protein